MRRLLLAVLLALSGEVTMAEHRILIVTATAGFRHEEAIAAAHEIIPILATNCELVFARNAEEMAALVSRENLPRMHIVMFVNTTGELPATSRQSLLQWIANGGVFIGVHSAADTWHSSPEYIDMLGAEFESHPPDAEVALFVDDPTHPSTRALPSPQPMVEEIYDFRNFHLDRVHMLLSLREHAATKEPGLYPLAWWKRYGYGHVFYTELGHRVDVWTSPWFQTHLAGAIEWARQVLPLRRRAVRSR